MTELSRLTPGQVQRCVAETDKNKWLARETLVAVVRGCRRAGNEDAARRVLEVLIRRHRPTIIARVKAWRTIPASDYEDAEGHVVIKLMEAVNSVAPSEELWECNFAGSFNWRVLTYLKQFAAQRTPTIETISRSASGEEYDRLAELPDGGAEISFQEIEVRELIASLSRDNPQIGEFLYLSMAGVSETVIASRLKVTDRTLRNWKTRLRLVLERDIKDRERL